MGGGPFRGFVPFWEVWPVLVAVCGFWGLWARQRRTSVRAQHSGPKIKGEMREGRQDGRGRGWQGRRGRKGRQEGSARARQDGGMQRRRQGKGEQAGETGGRRGRPAGERVGEAGEGGTRPMQDGAAGGRCRRAMQEGEAGRGGRRGRQDGGGRGARLSRLAIEAQPCSTKGLRPCIHGVARYGTVKCGYASVSHLARAVCLGGGLCLMGVSSGLGAACA